MEVLGLLGSKERIAEAVSSQEDSMLKMFMINPRI